MSVYRKQANYLYGSGAYAWLPSLELLKEVAPAPRPRTGPSLLFLMGLHPCQPDPVELCSPSPELRGQLLIELDGGTGTSSGSTVSTFFAGTVRDSTLHSHGACESPDCSQLQRRSPQCTSLRRRHRRRRWHTSSSSSASSDRHLDRLEPSAIKFRSTTGQTGGVEPETSPSRSVPPWDWRPQAALGMGRRPTDDQLRRSSKA